LGPATGGVDRGVLPDHGVGLRHGPLGDLVGLRDVGRLRLRLPTELHFAPLGGSPPAKPPVEPYPPAPRTESSRLSTSSNAARSKRCTTSWAIRSPRRSVVGVERSRLTSSTLISPR